MLDFLHKYLCFGNGKQRSASAHTLEKRKSADKYLCEKCHRDFHAKNQLELHRRSHCSNSNTPRNSPEPEQKTDIKTKQSSPEEPTEIKIKDDVSEIQKSMDKDPMNRSQLYKHNMDKSTISQSSVSTKAIRSNSRLSLDPNPGTHPDNNNMKKSTKIESVNQSELSVRLDPVDVIVNEIQTKSPEERLAIEQKFIEEHNKKTSNVKYAVAEEWITNYSNYLNGKIKSPPGSIPNQELSRQALTNTLPSHIYTVNETVWKFMIKLYGGGPEVQHPIRSVSSAASDSSDKSSEPPTADTMSRSEAGDSLRNSGTDVIKPALNKSYLCLNPVGMGNESFYCYMNSCLQALLSINEFVYYIYEEKYKKAASGKNLKFWKAMNEVILSHKTQNNYFIPKAIRKLSSNIFDPDDQHDAHEFLRFLLSGLQDELNLPRPKKEVEQTEPEAAWAYYRKYHVSLVDELFSGQLVNKVECASCGHVSTTFDPFLDLSLPIIPNKTKNLDDCLEVFQKEEEIKDSYKCEKCKSDSKIIKRLIVNKFPKYLAIHLKRFQLYPTKKKITEEVKFQMENWKIKKTNAKDQLSYSLVGSIVHRGSFDSGHYTCYTKRGREWIICDDESIKSVSAKEVSSKEAYLLIYERNE